MLYGTAGFGDEIVQPKVMRPEEIEFESGAAEWFTLFSFVGQVLTARKIPSSSSKFSIVLSQAFHRIHVPCRMWITTPVVSALSRKWTGGRRTRSWKGGSRRCCAWPTAGAWMP